MCHLRSLLGIIVGALIIFSGCSSTGNYGNVQNYSFTAVEPQWIRDGDPILYDGKRWYPQDDIEVLLDTEARLTGNYRGVQVFTAKMDVKPYQRLYTKFDINKFRYYVPKAK